MIAVLLLTVALTAQAGGLRIVVVEGEDAVNIIQQKTAVRPVVEVRDRNDLPVPGALVTFSIEGGKAASFAGASTLTVATNAAGQAAVTGLTPSAAGAFQIQVSAAFQGQVATATIAQTNVLTAAQAAAAGAATSGGGTAGGGAGGGAGGAGGAAGGAGGGMSATTIGIVGAAAGGGALAATQIARTDAPSGPTTFTGSFSGPFVSTLTAARTCTVTRTVTATMTLRLDLSSDTTVTGEGEITGTDSVTAQTCEGPAPTNAISARFRVNGTRASFGFSGEFTDSRPLEVDPRMTVQTTTNMQFEASLSGGVVSGTLKREERSIITGPNPTSTGSASATFAITLR